MYEMKPTGPLAPNFGSGISARRIRCPYCVERSEFKAMMPADLEGWFICDNCGHLTVPGNPEFQCRCPKCSGLGSKTHI
jgi:hypothetical protein